MERSLGMRGMKLSFETHEQYSTPKSDFIGVSLFFPVEFKPTKTFEELVESNKEWEEIAYNSLGFGIPIGMIKAPGASIKEANEVLVLRKEITLVLDYPFSVDVTTTIQLEDIYLTRRRLLNLIHDAYQEIFRLEKEALEAAPPGMEDPPTPFGSWRKNLNSIDIVGFNIADHKGKCFIHVETET